MGESFFTRVQVLCIYSTTAMSFARCARLARCRAANVSLWARQMNMRLDGCRILATVNIPARRVSAECLPPCMFPEQKVSITEGSSSVDASQSSVKGDAVAELIESLLMEGTGTAVSITTPMFLTTANERIQIHEKLVVV